MTRIAAFLALALLATACGEAPMGQAEGPAAPPADAPASTPPGPDFSGDFDLVGTEPFWGGRIRTDGLTLSRAGQPDVAAANGGVAVKGLAGVWGTGHLVFRLQPEPCSDGMSDRRYGYRAEATINGEVLRGCAARPAELAAQPRP